MSATLFSALQMLGSGVSAFGQYEQGRTQQQAYEYNSSVAIQESRQQVKASEHRFSRLAGEQRALLAKAGVDLSSGSPLLILANTAMQEEEEQQRIRFSGESAARMSQYSGKMARWSGLTSGISTFITGLGKSGMGYLKGTKGYKNWYD